MKRLRKMVGLLVFINSFLLAGSLLASEEWWDKHWEYRVPLSFENNSEIDLISQPVVITGEAFSRKVGMKGINTNSFRLIKEGEELPIQVDERDGTGLFVKEPNYVLNNDDEIIFEVDAPKGKETTYLLYFSKKPKPQPDYETDLKIKSLSDNDFGQTRVINSKLNFIIKGIPTKTGVPPAHFANVGCGAITSLQMKGIEMLHAQHTHAQVIPNARGGCSTPEVIIDGSVRKVISVGQRYFALYKNSGRIDFEDLFVSSKEVKYRLNYGAGRFDKNDSLLVPLAGEVEEINMGEIEFGEKEIRTFYSTPRPEEGWFAWFDKEQKIGLAAFFDHTSSQLTIRSSWPKEYLGKPMGKPDNFLTCQAKGEKIKLTFFAVEDKEEVEPLYEFWKKPDIKFGIVEER